MNVDRKMKLFWKEKIITGREIFDEGETPIETTFIKVKSGTLENLAKGFAHHNEFLADMMPDEGGGSAEFIALTNMRNEVLPESWFTHELDKVGKVI